MIARSSLWRGEKEGESIRLRLPLCPNLFGRGEKRRVRERT